MPYTFRLLRRRDLVVVVLVTGACHKDTPTGPKSYAGVDGEYTIGGRFEGAWTSGARFSGRVTLRQPNPNDPEMTGTAAVSLYSGNTVTNQYVQVFNAQREGETGVRFLLTAASGTEGSWEFVGTVNGAQIAGTQYLDWFRVPGTGSYTGVGGAWSGTR